MMPPVKNAGDLVPAYSALLEAVTNGELTSRQAQEIKSILDSMLIAFKNKLGPPIKHIFRVHIVQPTARDPNPPYNIIQPADTSDEVA